MMKKTTGIFAVICLSTFMTACQTTSQEFNGKSGYQIIDKTASTATMNYILSGHAKYDQHKLQASCQSVLGAQRNYTVNVLNTQEIVNSTVEPVNYGRQIGNSRTSIGLSNTPDLHNNDNLATREALEVRPTMLRSIRYTCS